MLRLDELETLSRFAAGDLPPDQAAQLKTELHRRPELAAALEQLGSLNRALKQLPPTLDPAELEALVARLPRPRRTWVVGSRLAPTAGLAAAALVVTIAAFLVSLNREPRPRLVALSGSVTLDGRAVASPSEALALQPGAVVRCGVESASIIESRQARVLLARGSELVVSGDAPPTFALQSGTLAATGPEIHLAAGDAHLELSGRAVLSWEPEDDLLRVTDGMETKQPARLGFKWLRLPIAATAVAAGGVTLFVLEGRAKVTTDSTAPVEVAAGQKWTSRSARSSPIASSAALTAGAEAGRAIPKQEPVPAVAASTDAQLATLSRDRLVAEVKRLRSENNALSQRNKEIQRKLEDSDPKREAQKENFYRSSADDLRALAERGEMRLHPPMGSDGLSGFDPSSRVASDLGLQPNEEAEIRNIFARSNQRLHDGLASLYVGIGGDPNVASSLETNGLLAELQSKTPQADRPSAALTATRERGGLERPANPNEGSALLRAYRLYYLEEDRVLDELDRLLGPDRAEQFMNHQNTSHNVLSTRSGPDKQGR